MAFLKFIEVVAESDQSWEDATGRAVRIAAQSVRHIRSVTVEGFEAAVSENRIRAYRVKAKIAFALEAGDE